MYGYIYITTNLVNGKKYIGRRKSNKFLGTEYLGSGVHLKRAINKYGHENFIVEMIDCSDTYEDLVLKETRWIKYYNAVESNEFYNHSYGGFDEGFVKGDENIINIPENKAKMIKAKQGSTWTDEARKSHERYWSENHEKMSQEATRRNQEIANDPDRYAQRRENMSKAQTGRKHTEETKEAIRQANTGKIMMNDGVSNKWVSIEDVNKYVELGYVKGGLPRNRNYSGENNPMYGKRGSNSPNYGRVTVNNGIIRKKVFSDEVQEYIDKGWKIGWKF